MTYTLFAVWIAISVFWFRRYGPAQLLWFCDVSLLLTAIGLWIRSGLLVTAQLVAVLAFHLLWNVDFWSCLLVGAQPTWGTAYMFYPELSLAEKSLSFFSHLFVVPVAFYAVRILGAPDKAWLVQWAQTGAIFLLTYLWTRPEQNINWMFGAEMLAISPTRVHPLIYYSLMVFVPPFLIYWPINRLMTWTVQSGKGLRISAQAATAALLIAGAASVGVPYHVGRTFGPDPEAARMGNRKAAPLEPLPPSRRATILDRISFGMADRRRHAVPTVFPYPALPKHMRTVLGEVEPERIPAVPQEILIHGKRSVEGSIVWALVASDDLYLQPLPDLNRRKDQYEVRCQIGGRGVSEFVDPSTGELYTPAPHNVILGNGTGGVYAIGAIEVVRRVVVSRSRFYLVKRRGILLPEDVWFVEDGKTLRPLLSDPSRPASSRVAFQSTADHGAAVDVFVSDFFGYSYRNLTANPRVFNGFITSQGAPCPDAGWAGSDVLRFCTASEGRVLRVQVRVP